MIGDESSGLGPRLLWAKHKLASLKGSETIPRLELGAAVMGTELAFFICKTFGWDLNQILYFSDSMTVLWWMQSTQILNPYVANRLQKIGERSSPRQWLHVVTDQNPADIPTRGIRPEKLQNCSKWWTGPKFLSQDPQLWDKQPEIRETVEAAAERRTLESICKGIVLAVRIANAEKLPGGYFLMDILLRTKSFERGCRVADKVLEAVSKFQGKTTCCDSKIRILSHAQDETLLELKGSLRRKQIPNQRYWPLQPFLDENGIIRINGRLTPYLERSRDEAQPILLSKEMELVQLLLWEVHAVELKHCGGINTLLARVRKKYWIIRGPEVAREVVRNCLFCARLLAKPYKLPLPPLHISRSGKIQETLRAFMEVGVDFCGPFQVKVGRSFHKRYAMIIACCTTRAINVEVCHTLTGQSCLAALERHCARYSQPRYINSDNGSNFLSSARHLEERIDILRGQHVPEHKRWHPNIQWNFNPPSSPTWTGHVECFVKLVKRALKRLEPRYCQSFTDESLHTALVMTIGYINSRPLMTVGSERPPLTPADFLLTGARELCGIPVVDRTRMTLKTRKELLDLELDASWKIFQEEYLLYLRQRNKTWPAKNILETGDLVVLKDEERLANSGKWRAGKILKTHEAKDNYDRSYDILVDGEVLYKRNYRTLGKLPSPSLIPNQLLQESCYKKGWSMHGWYDEL